ncbi:ATP-binding protein [Streptomyces sp. NBC_00289]|uniref:ATP-binding protein n=1 Tax=Streptomyces sp. NBC_00289 TaxID=2975703 RepID=UPI003244DF4D
MTATANFLGVGDERTQPRGAAPVPEPHLRKIQEDGMMTTALRTPRTVLHREGYVMNERFQVAPRCKGAPPRVEDARRVGVMRRIAAARLRYCGLTAMTDDVMVVVSELLTNAVLHSDSQDIGLSITLRDSCLRIAVTDGRPGVAATRRCGSDYSESGRGLHLVQAIAEMNGGRWGTEDAGATTWCTLAISAPGRP